MICKILISTLPVFFGLVFFSIVVFPSAYKFSSFSLATMSLFALYQMDSTLDIFKDITRTNFLIGVVFMIFFWVFVHIISRRIFVVLIEDSYVVTQMKNKQSWILNHVKFDVSQLASEPGDQNPNLDEIKKYHALIEEDLANNDPELSTDNIDHIFNALNSELRYLHRIVKEENAMSFDFKDNNIHKIN